MMDVIRCNMCGKEFQKSGDTSQRKMEKPTGSVYAKIVMTGWQTALKYRYRETKRQNICRTRESFEYKMTLFSLQEKWFTDRVETEVGG